MAFHGFRDEEILVGGGASFRLKAEIASSTEKALSATGIRVRIAGPDDGFSGESPRNLVNRLTATRRSGIQIEQSLQARTDHALDIAHAVADVFAARLGGPRYPGPRWRRLLKELWTGCATGGADARVPGRGGRVAT